MAYYNFCYGAIPHVTQKEMQEERLRLVQARPKLSINALIQQIHAELDVWVPRLTRLCM